MNGRGTAARTRRGLAVAVVALVIAVVGLQATVDVGPVRLGRSLAVETDSAYYNACHDLGTPRAWCRVQDGEEKTSAVFRMRQTSRRCWEARRTRLQFATREVPVKARGCVGAVGTVMGWVKLGPQRYDAP